MEVDQLDIFLKLTKNQLNKLNPDEVEQMVDTIVESEIRTSVKAKRASTAIYRLSFINREQTGRLFSLIPALSEITDPTAARIAEYSDVLKNLVRANFRPDAEKVAEDIAKAIETHLFKNRKKYVDPETYLKFLQVYFELADNDFPAQANKIISKLRELPIQESSRFQILTGALDIFNTRVSSKPQATDSLINLLIISSRMLNSDLGTFQVPLITSHTVDRIGKQTKILIRAQSKLKKFIAENDDGSSAGIELSKLCGEIRGKLSKVIATIADATRQNEIDRYNRGEIEPEEPDSADPDGSLAPPDKFPKYHPGRAGGSSFIEGQQALPGFFSPKQDSGTADPNNKPTEGPGIS